MKITGDWIGEGTLQRVLGCLTDAGHQALLVGGCVRDGLLGVPVGDLDISTDALPETVRDLALAQGFKVVPTGIAHGTVTVVAEGRPHEITTFRRDVETDGRRAVVAYSDRIEEDAIRRDFTMNALYADAAGRVIDPLGGLPDLMARRVRFVGRPEDRIREDYLRILRFFRFYATHGDPDAGLDPEGLAACAALSAGIDTLSRERVGHEMRKLLAAADPAPAVAAMQAAGILAHVLPGADSRALAPLVHLEAGCTSDAIRRLAAIGGEDPPDALRLSRDEARRLDLLKEGTASTAGAGELAYRHGLSVACDVFLLRAAVMGMSVPPGWRAEAERGAAAQFPLRAADLSDRFQGPALGARLKELETRWIASDFELSREQLLA